MKFIAPIVAAFLLLLPSLSLAETKDIVAEGTYNMGDGETPTVAESRALLQAKRTAVEEAGTYVESYSKTKNFQLTADEIQVLASGIMEVEVLEKKRTVIGDGFNFWIKIKAKVSTDKMEEMAKRVKEKSVVEDYKKIQAAYDKSQKEIEELKRQLAGAKGGKEKQQIEAKIADDERFFQANEMFERGSTYAEKGQFDKAIEDYNKAIDLYPDNVLAYYYRGMAYYKKNQYSKAFEDYRKAININQNAYDNYYGLVYYNSGVTHIKEGYSGGFIYDIGDAVFDPPVSDDDYFDHPFLDEELKILTTKISIDTNNAVAFYKRGNVYLNKGLFDKSIKDYDRAITINPDYSLAYRRRGDAYTRKRQYNIAIKDFNKTITLDSNDDIAYYDRGMAYYRLGKDSNAIADFQKACDMGNENGCKNLQEALGKR